MYEEFELLPGERLLWSGTPVRYPVFDRTDLLVVPMTLLWCGFAISWEIGVTRGGWNFGTIWGIPFVLVGLYMVFGRLVVRRMRRRSTRYAVTDRRVIELSSKPRRLRNEAYLNQLPPPVADTRDGVVGHVAFGSFPSYVDAMVDLPVVIQRRRPPGPIVLRDVSRPRQVRDVIAHAQSAPH